MIKRKRIWAAFIALTAITVYAQDDYLVKTTTGQQNTVGSEEERFVTNNFPYYSICDWKAGQKFMVVVEDRYGFIPTLKSYTGEREIANSKMQHKILSFQGTEEIETESYIGANYFSRFIFDSENEKYYHEVKQRNVNDICGNNPRALIHNLVYLGDVDIARELLVGKTLYMKVTKAQVGNGRADAGSREVNIPINMEVTVSAVGAGTRECPVKIVFEDTNGNSYFRNVLFSKTNSGLLDSDLVGPHLDKCFSNVFSFSDKGLKTNDDIRSKYVGKTVYPKRHIEVAGHDGSLQTLLRYTPLIIKEMTFVAPGTMVTLKVADKNGQEYLAEVDLKYDIFIRNENYINDTFGVGDLRNQYPGISEENWVMLSKGEVKTGMTKKECQLALGSPIQIVANMNTDFETWYYHRRTIEFDGGRILRMK